MSLSRFRRLASITSAALLATMLLGTGVTSAAVAPFEFQAGYSKSLPPTVGPNTLAGYSFRIHNKLSQNISQLTLSAPDAGAAAFVSNSRNLVCQKSPTLVCAFGSLAGFSYIDVTVAYPVGTTGISVTFNLDSTGGPTTDGHHSHGDSVSTTLSTSVSSSKNFAGGFQVDGGTFKTDDTTLGKRNLQSTGVHSTLQAVPVNVTDGFASFPGTGDDPCATLNCVGDWAQISIGTGSEGPVEVTILIYGNSVKGNPALSTFGLWHEGSDPNPIILSCTDPSSIPSVNSASGAECVDTTMQGANYLLHGWLKHNGTIRGLFG